MNSKQLSIGQQPEKSASLGKSIGCSQSSNMCSHTTPDGQPPTKRIRDSESARACMRIVSYNVRVDCHPDDIDTCHHWSIRRPLVVATIRGLRSDLIGLQEPSPTQARELQEDLGDTFGVAVEACNPEVWNGGKAPSGQDRDGNGFMWRKSRLRCDSIKTVWLNPVESKPWPKDSAPPWGASPFQRTCVVGRFTELHGGRKITAITAHFDHKHTDEVKEGGSEAQKQSAALVMRLAKMATQSDKADVVVVMGDFNTFKDRDGACYQALVANASSAGLVDVRDSGALEVDMGRGGGSWEGWPTNSWSRAKKPHLVQRYDQMFISTKVRAERTSVLEERYPIVYMGKRTYVYASDHLPIFADVILE